MFLPPNIQILKKKIYKKMLIFPNGFFRKKEPFDNPKNLFLFCIPERKSCAAALVSGLLF